MNTKTQRKNAVSAFLTKLTARSLCVVIGLFLYPLMASAIFGKPPGCGRMRMATGSSLLMDREANSRF